MRIDGTLTLARTSEGPRTAEAAATARRRVATDRRWRRGLMSLAVLVLALAWVAAPRAVAVTTAAEDDERPYTWWLGGGYEPIPVDRLAPVLRTLALSPDQLRSVAIHYGDHVARVHDLMDEHASRDPITIRGELTPLESARLSTVGWRRARRLAESVAAEQVAFVDTMAMVLSDEQAAQLAAVRPAVAYDTVNFRAIGIWAGAPPINVAGLVTALVPDPVRRDAALAACDVHARSAARLWQFAGLERHAAWQDVYLAFLEADPDLDYRATYPEMERRFHAERAPVIDRLIRASEADRRALQAAMNALGPESPDALRVYGGAMAMVSPNLIDRGRLLAGIADRLAAHEMAVERGADAGARDQADANAAAGDATGDRTLEPHEIEALWAHAADLRAAIQRHRDMIDAMEYGRHPHPGQEIYQETLTELSTKAAAAHRTLRDVGGAPRHTPWTGAARAIYASRAGSHSFVPNLEPWTGERQVRGLWDTLDRTATIDVEEPAVIALRRELEIWAPFGRLDDGDSERDGAGGSGAGDADPAPAEATADKAVPARRVELALTPSAVPHDAWATTHDWIDRNETVLGADAAAWGRFTADAALREHLDAAHELGDWTTVPLGFILLRSMADVPASAIGWLHGFEAQRVALLADLPPPPKISDDGRMRREDPARTAALADVGALNREAVATLSTLLGAAGRDFLDAVDRRRVPWLIERQARLAAAVQRSARAVGAADGAVEERLNLAVLDAAFLDLRAASRDVDVWWIDGPDALPMPAQLMGERARGFADAQRRVTRLSAAARLLDAMRTADAPDA